MDAHARDQLRPRVADETVRSCADGGSWDRRLVDYVEVVEEDDDGKGREDDADRDAIAEAALPGGWGEAALLVGL